MEIYVEILGNLQSACVDGAYETGNKYKLFRIYAKNSGDDNTIYFNCIVNQGTPSYRYLETLQVGMGDTLLVRGRLRQKFVFEDKTFVNPDTLQKEVKTVQICKNQVYVNAITLINKANDITQMANVELAPKVSNTNNNREKVPVNPNDNPFNY